MREIRHVLVGVELKLRTSELTTGSKTAFEQAVRLAESTHADLTVLHSRWHQGEVWPLAPEGEAQLEELRQQGARRGVSTRTVITEERAWLALVRAGNGGGADALVVGKRDAESTDAPKRNGPVASKLLRKSAAPVWVVKPNHDLQHKLVLVATDLTPVGDEALEFGAYLARQSGGALHVVHAYRIPVDLKLEARSCRRRRTRSARRSSRPPPRPRWTRASRRSNWSSRRRRTCRARRRRWRSARPSSTSRRTCS